MKLFYASVLYLFEDFPIACHGYTILCFCMNQDTRHLYIPCSNNLVLQKLYARFKD